MKMIEMKERELAVLPCIHEGPNYRLYLQKKSAHGRPVVIKTLRAVAGEQPTERLINEYHRTTELDLAGVRKARYRLLAGGRPALALDYVEGETLQEGYIQTSRSLKEKLEVAIAVAAILEEMHRNKFIHRNLASAHILVSSPPLAVTLIGFSDCAMEGVAGQQEADLSASMLAYISPEQTGRTKRRADHRADLYSFGAVLYELFTGRPPFEAVGPSELVYAHLAQNPQPPQALNSQLPDALSDMIMRLLAKNPDERYQSAFGIQSDLEAALKQLRRTGRIRELELAHADYSSLFHLPDRFYDRESELTALRTAVRGANSGGVLLVTGPAGIGKSALLDALRPYVVGQGAYFAAGSYESSQRHVPYAGLRQAFEEWVDLMLTESSEQLTHWKSELIEACGDSVGLLLDMLPRLKLVIGPQSPAPELDSAQAQHRFHNLLRSFIFASVRQERPLVLFLDNMQWADQASLQLLDMLFHSLDSQPVLIVVAYRDDEVGEGHPLTQLIYSVTARGGKVSTLSLQELPLENVNRLISDTIKVDISITKPLTRLVLEKAGGNPLFVRQFLQSLYDKGLLVFEPDSRSWSWDVEAIRQRLVVGSVAGLLTEKIDDLPEATRTILALAACIGNRFRTRLLALVAKLTEKEVVSRLQPAVEAGLLKESSLPLAPGSVVGAVPETGFEFPHDRVRQAAYDLLPQKQQRVNHLRIGRLLLSQTPKEILDEHVFEIADQINEGFEYLQDEEERHHLIALNLMAGRKAMRAAAYLAAIRYLSMGIGLLPSDCWENRAEPTLELYMEAVKAEYLSVNFERAALLSKNILQHTNDLFTRLRVHEQRILFLTAQNQNLAAIESGFAALEELGVSLSEDIPAADLQKLAALRGQIKTFERLPAMSDPRQLASLRILMHLAAPAFRVNSRLLEAIISKMVLLSVDHGNSPMAAFAYGWYGAILCGNSKDIEAGYRFGRLSMDVLRQFHAPELESRVNLLFNAYVRHWKEPVREGIFRLQEVFQWGIATGDLEYTSLGAVHNCGYLLFTGWPLEVVRHKQLGYLETMEQWRLQFQAQLLRIWLQTSANLCGGEGDPTRLRGEFFDETKHVAEWMEENNTLSMFCMLSSRTMLQYLFGDYRAAAASGKQAESYEHGALGLYYRANHSFYYALSLLAIGEIERSKGRSEYIEQVNLHTNRLRQWAVLAPMNFAHKLALVEAEHARVRGKNGRAIERFNDAVRLARENDHLMDEAIIREREAMFYNALGRNDIADMSLRKALDRYRSWGAMRKVEMLERRFQTLLRKEPALLDTAAILKVSQTLFQEVRLEQLLEKLMRILVENAGAEKGVLIQKSADSLSIQASYDNGVVKTMQAEPVSDSREVAHSVVNYVERTHSEVVLGDASRDPTFSSDNYIAEHRVRSLLCLPIIYQGKFSGLLYLENNLASDLFTADRLALLEALASLAAISMENATLYTELENNIAALRKSEQKFRVIFDQTFQFIGMMDTNGILLEANRSSLRFAGISEEEVLGKPFWDTPWWTHSVELQQRLKRAVQEANSGKMVRFEATHITPDGQVGYIDFSLKPVTDANGRVILLIPEGRDITERKRAEEELLRYKERLEDTVQQRTEELRLARDAAETANKAKSIFLANMSHELRTPLNAILGFSRMMQQDNSLSEHQRETLNIINNSGEHLLKLINDVLEIAKIEAGKLQLESAAFDLHALVREVSDMMRLRAEQQGLQLVLDQASEFPHYINGDEARLRQILVNLVSNAVKFTEEGGVTIRLGVKNNTQRYLLIEIEDTGPGISEADKQHLFKPFVQLTAGTSEGGTGLGLSIVQQFVKLMGGNISVESTPGKGSLFCVELPLNEVDEADVIRLGKEVYGEVIGLAPGQPNFRVLVAEDQHDNQLLLTKLMTEIGLEVEVADNGEQCIELFEQWKPDLIWMDRRMPVMDGEEATRRIRKLPGGDKVKIIAVTASAFKEQQQELSTAGMDGFVSKPYRFREIYQSLERHLGVRFLYAETEAEPPVLELEAERLAALPEALRAELRAALESLDVPAITTAIQHVAAQDAELAKCLSKIAERLDYPTILTGLK